MSRRPERKPPKPVLTQSVRRTLDRVSRREACRDADVTTARAEMVRVMRNFGATTQVESASGDFTRTAEAWWRLLGGLA